MLINMKGLEDKQNRELFKELGNTLLEKGMSDCTGCGWCCKNEFNIAVTKKELRKISECLNTTYKKLKQEKDIRRHPFEKSMFAIKGGSCVFLDCDNKCKIYDVRPYVCFSYPFGIILYSVLMNTFPVTIPKDCEIIKNWSKEELDLTMKMLYTMVNVPLSKIKERIQ